MIPRQLKKSAFLQKMNESIPLCDLCNSEPIKKESAHYIYEEPIIIIVCEYCLKSISDSGLTFNEYKRNYCFKSCASDYSESNAQLFDEYEANSSNKLDNPDELKTIQESYLNILKHSNPFVIKYIPEKFRTEEMFLVAMCHFSELTKYIPEVLQTKELYLKLIEKYDDSNVNILNDAKTHDFYLDAVKNGVALEDVPKNLRTKEICVKAVEKCGRNLKYVPREMITDELCKISINACDDSSLEYVPEHLRTLEICIMAFHKNKSMIEFIPENIWQLTPSLFK